MRKTNLTVIACAMLLCAGTAHATVIASKACEQAKLIAQGELEYCLAQNIALGLEGGPNELATCQAVLTAGLAQAGQAGSCRYLNNGDGTVSDLNTGLMWEMKTTTAGVHDVSNTYAWTSEVTIPDGGAFTLFLATLNGGTSSNGVSTSGCFAGHCDWRLPIIEELNGIVDLSAPGCGTGSPCIDPTFGPTQFYYYWSATTDAGGADSAWTVYFGNGGAFGDSKTGGSYVRAVRSGL